MWGVHWKNWFVGGFPKKPIYRWRLPKKGDLNSLQISKGSFGKKEEVWNPNAHYDCVKYPVIVFNCSLFLSFTTEIIFCVSLLTIIHYLSLVNLYQRYTSANKGIKFLKLSHSSLFLEKDNCVAPILSLG